LHGRRKVNLRAMARYLLIIVCLCSQFETTAQRDLPITLSTETSTTYYTDGSSRSNSRMFFNLWGELNNAWAF